MKRRFLGMAVLLAALAMPFYSSVAMAMDVDPMDAESIQAVVQLQLRALAEDDAVGAFSLTTSSTRVQIGNPDNFLRMIKEEYAPIYRNRHAIFSPPEVIDGDIIEMVRVTDRDNRVWVALYRMERDIDGSWKIDGCRLLETTSISV